MLPDGRAILGCRSPECSAAQLCTVRDYFGAAICAAGGFLRAEQASVEAQAQLAVLEMVMPRPERSLWVSGGTATSTQLLAAMKKVTAVRAARLQCRQRFLVLIERAALQVGTVCKVSYQQAPSAGGTVPSTNLVVEFKEYDSGVLASTAGTTAACQGLRSSCAAVPRALQDWAGWEMQQLGLYAIGHMSMGYMTCISSQLMLSQCLVLLSFPSYMRVTQVVAEVCRCPAISAAVQLLLWPWTPCLPPGTSVWRGLRPACPG